MVCRLIKYFVAAIGAAAAILLLFYFADQGVLGMAAKYADDEPKLIKFMSDMGYPKTGEWCGEFAASVIKRAGGTPPSGAAIASNWRGYGTPDAMPHVGDVAVANIAHLNRTALAAIKTIIETTRAPSNEKDDDGKSS